MELQLQIGVSKQWHPGSTKHTSYTQCCFFVKKAHDLFLFPLFSTSSLAVSILWSHIVSLAHSLSSIWFLFGATCHSNPSIYHYIVPSISLCFSLDPDLISEHLVQGNSSWKQGQSSLQAPTQVAFCWNWYFFKYMFVFNTSWHGSNMFLCVLALSALLRTLANIET